jgi:hypothetical protein
MRTITSYEYKIDNDILFFKDKTGFHKVRLVAPEDDIYIFREGKITYALALNTHFGHVELQAFEGGDLIGHICMQDESILNKYIGKQWYNMTPMTIVKRLALYV